MFNTDFDPLARLEALEININALNSDKFQLMKAFNHHVELIELLNKQMANLSEQIKIQEEQIQLLHKQTNISRALR